MMRTRVLMIFLLLAATVSCSENGTKSDPGPYPPGSVLVNLNDSDVTTTTTTSSRFDRTKYPNRIVAEEKEAIVIARGVLDLGNRLLSEMLKERLRESEVISPLCIASAMYLLQMGSARDTLKELNSLLGLDKQLSQDLQHSTIHKIFSSIIDDAINDRDDVKNDDKPHPEYNQNLQHEISVANAIFLANEVQTRYVFEKAANLTYKSKVKKMDFLNEGTVAQKYINGWVEERTHGKIKQILSVAPDSETKMIVVSALYFKALWWEEVGVQVVMPLPFYPEGVDKKNKTKEVNTLIVAGEYIPYVNSSKYKCHLLGLRYQKQLTTFWIILPYNSSRDTLTEFHQNLTADHIEEMIAETREHLFTSITVPKFHITNQVNLKSAMYKMGVRKIFDQNQADLSIIAAGKNETESSYRPRTIAETLAAIDEMRIANYTRKSGLFVGDIVHKVDLTVDERGTEGGAATALILDRISGSTLRVNTPFLFVIRQDMTRLPLFYGAIFEP